jgi:hypothetical protein
MAVARNTGEKLKARAAAGRRERLIIFADQGFLLEAAPVGVEPELRDFGDRAAARIRVVRPRDRSIWVPAVGEIHHPHHCAGLEVCIVYGEKPAT